jgi:DNA-binding transcriptional LysR family regulator
MELRHLRYFVAVAEELHFGRAAQRLHIAQPPLSQQIRRLEQDLGGCLFHRTNRRVELTDAGRALLVEARLTLAQAERARDVVSRTARGEVGQLLVGHMASAELNVFPRLLPAFRRRHPGVEVVFQLAGESEQLQMLRDGQIHAGFLRVPAVDHALTVKPIFREPLVAVLPARHPLARHRSVTLAELRDERFIFFPRRFAPTYYDALMAIFRDAGVEPRIVHDTNRLHTVLSLVATGRGVSLTGKCVERLGRPGIVCRPLRPRVPNIEMAIAYDSRNPSPLLRSFLAVVARVFPPVR